MTPSHCVRRCAAFGYLFARVQNGNQCWCGNTFGSKFFLPKKWCSNVQRKKLLPSIGLHFFTSTQYFRYSVNPSCADRDYCRSTHFWWLVESYLIERNRVEHCMTILGIFPHEMKDIILCEVRLNPCKVRLKRTLVGRWRETRKNPQFLFGWRGHLVTIFDQFTFFRYHIVWTISRHSSGTWTQKNLLTFLKNQKNSKFIFGWRGHLVTIFDQFTFFMCSTVWTISRHSSGTWT